MLTTIAHSLPLFENTLWLAIWRIFSQSKCFKLEADLIYFANDGHSGETLIKVPSLNFFTLWKSITQTNERTSKLRWEQVELGCVGGGGQVVSMLVFLPTIWVWILPKSAIIIYSGLKRTNINKRQVRNGPFIIPNYPQLEWMPLLINKGCGGLCDKGVCPSSLNISMALGLKFTFIRT